jgi:hypothetical protein
MPHSAGWIDGEQLALGVRHAGRSNVNIFATVLH